jgi:NAD(P)H-flavin reductase/quinol-cytochrome oxidoreductase complex cytochrome b subunit
MLRIIHHTGQAAFLAVEKLFNRAFGEASNPFYYLGAISYYLLWIVVASGLYLYAFFSTGVSEAYQSVEAITHNQRWFGGILRSLHRYASDGMILTMLLHVVRHFVFDHYRAFRWFSWVSGVVLLWLVYMSGVNGYMLPWDRLAQFVVVATTEWLDWLPIFNGTLVRNFITPNAVNDRLFSLLSFIHIGFPLGVLGLLWVHTQRAPGAKTNPPRSIAIPFTIALVVLSIAKPAVSLEPADLASAPVELAFDWFYLPALALLYYWGPTVLWAVVGGGTLFMLALPWLPPKRGSKVIRHVAVRPDNRIVPCRPQETVLEAVLREDIKMPYDCRNGGCGQCKCTLLYGDVEFGPYQPSVLSDEERRAGKILACIATPVSDIEIEYEPIELPGGLRPKTWRAKVVSMAKAAEDVMIVHLAVEGDEPLHFYAGQYINIVLPDGVKRAFSFATAPGAGPTIELQIRRVPGGRYTTHVFEEMKVGDAVDFEGPLGSFFLREDSSKPIVFVAGATGFAPVKSMVEHAFATGLKRKMVLYWGTRKPGDMYARELCEQWAKDHPATFKFVPVISEASPEDGWTGRTGLVHEAILADFPTLAGHQVYACGSVAMVEAAHPAFRARGMDPNDCFSDAFRLTPHLARATPAEEVVKLGGA